VRIISGYAKGRKLFTPPAGDNSIRPTSDRAREALFSIIGEQVQGAAVLDLFAGTGAFGCEALSRGAKSICFVDFYPSALELIGQNLQVCMDAFANHQKKLADNTLTLATRDASGPAFLIKHDLRKGLPFFSGKRHFPSSFDLIFLDPPYSQGLSLQLLQALDTSSLLHPHALLIVEDRAKETLPPHLTSLSLVDQRKYGEAGFWFYQALPKETPS
jgi:16S rRNA (guanine966-N2)-methyltransferase